MQTVFSKIYEMGKEKLPINHEASWLYSVAKNETISYIRKKVTTVELEEIYDIESTDNSIEEIIDSERYKKIISTLNDKEKEIVSLKVLANLSFREIGKLLDEPTNTVKWRYYKAIHSLEFLITNLALFVISIVIGIKSVFNQRDKAQNEQITEDIEKENTILDSTQDEHRRNDTLQDINTTTSETKKEHEAVMENEITNTVQVTKPEVKDGNLSFFQVGILVMAFVFFVCTICFLVSFVKSKVRRSKNK